MLAEMVRAFSFRVGEQRGLDFLRKAVPILAHEYEYWMDEEKFHVARVKPSFGDHAGKTYVLNLYSSKTGLPRPESYREDVATAEGTVPTKRAALYDNIAAAAESGWDFSSRWIDPRRGLALENLVTQQIVPVDLNAILLRVERTLALSHEVLAGGADWKVLDPDAVFASNHTWPELFILTQ